MSPVTITPSKKRKHPVVSSASEVPAKIRKTEKKDGKGKGRDREFHVVNASLLVSIPPVFSANLRAGVDEMLDSMVMRYIPALRGVVLSHSNVRFAEKTATIKADCPFLVCKVNFDATVWSPHVGMKLVGKVNLCSPDHVSLLVHRTFNVSIPRHHIPSDTWEFEYGPAENDPEFAPDALNDVDAGTSDTKEKQEEESGGKWVHKLTGQKLGDTDGQLEFTVIGLTVANEMLSLLGSIQADPFSPEYIIRSRSPMKAGEAELDTENIDTGRGDMSADEDDIDSDEDAFAVLGRKADEAAAEEVRHRAEEKETVKTDKRRKLKAEAREGKEKKQKLKKS
ncbi:hypothetical protein BDQ12DRAFT_673321 [Crucibulum laeve]|uniref:RPA43 OB domain-containing protein n=1 Tax=Crucibulum laeve TaxID=68775 RepID=A0A5C3MIX0_9AGAR|nr:hypothetical protein BDQ12DRAFT_673321 [Crucibulum laeve]